MISLLAKLNGALEESLLISKLNRFFNFDHNIFLYQSSSVSEGFINSHPSQTPQTIYVYQSGNITVLDSLAEIQSKNAFMIVVLASSVFNENFELLKFLDKIKVSLDIKVGFFFRRFAAIED